MDNFESAVPTAIEHELDLVRQAIAMVASGRSRRVVVASLGFGSELLPEAQMLAADAGVSASAVWTLDRRSHSIVIELKDPA